MILADGFLSLSSTPTEIKIHIYQIINEIMYKWRMMEITKYNISIPIQLGYNQ